MQPTKRCRICGDKALGFNFNGLSCESCRVFFIRNAYRHENLHCPLQILAKCEITLLSRNCCQRCRLDKCVEIGMRKELIRGKYAVGNVLNSHANVALLNESSILFNRPLQMNEFAFIYELQGAMSAFCEEANLEIVGPSRCLVDAYQFSLQHFRSVIKFCKSIRAFKILKECDQLMLLREFLCQINMIRCAFMFDRQKDGYPMLLNSEHEHNQASKAIFIKVNIFGQWKRRNVEHFIRNVLHSLQLEMENDVVVRNLFIAHALFKPLEGVTCPELIRYHYHVYRHLLKRYYENKYGHTLAAAKYSSLMQLLSAMSQMKQICNEIYADINLCNNDQTNEVLKDIFSFRM